MRPMRGRELGFCIVIVALLLPGFAAPTRAQTTPPTPYASISAEVEGYAGPGRASASDLKGQVVRIGLLAPLHGARKAEGEAMVAAAKMALRDTASQRMGHGRRVALAVEDESGSSWGMVSDAVIRLMLDDEAVAVITSTSGADTHLCEQVGNRIGVPVLTLSADATTTQIDIPWIFRMGPSYAQEAQGISQDIYSVRKLQNVLLITQRDQEGSHAIQAMKQATSVLSARVPNVIVLDGSSLDFESIIERIGTESPRAIIIWTNPSTASNLVHVLQIAGVKALRYLSQDASSEMREASTSELAASDAWSIANDDESAIDRQSFSTRFRQSTGADPDRVASQTYDAMILTVNALQIAGPNRARVRDELARTSSYDGVSGKISFDHEGNNRVPLHPVQLKQ
jgi:branched-chain amino acid transport system substrate-binding protein